MQELESHGFYSAVLTAPLFHGADRVLVMWSGLFLTVVAILLWEVYGFMCCVGGWCLLVWLYRYMADADPFMRLVYLRSRKYQPWYPAKAGMHSRKKRVALRWV